MVIVAMAGRGRAVDGNSGYGGAVDGNSGYGGAGRFDLCDRHFGKMNQTQTVRN